MFFWAEVVDSIGIFFPNIGLVIHYRKSLSSICSWRAIFAKMKRIKINNMCLGTHIVIYLQVLQETLIGCIFNLNNWNLIFIFKRGSLQPNFWQLLKNLFQFFSVFWECFQLSNQTWCHIYIILFLVENGTHFGNFQTNQEFIKQNLATLQMIKHFPNFKLKKLEKSFQKLSNEISLNSEVMA